MSNELLLLTHTLIHFWFFGPAARTMDDTLTRGTSVDDNSLTTTIIVKQSHYEEATINCKKEREKLQMRNANVSSKKAEMVCSNAFVSEYSAFQGWSSNLSDPNWECVYLYTTLFCPRWTVLSVSLVSCVARPYRTAIDASAPAVKKYLIIDIGFF